LSLRTFHRLFKTHLGVSPITHQRIARFRHSLENKFFQDKFKNLTEIGYESNFYDQSYFIKLYNQLAGSNPGTLFSKLEQLGDSKLVFEFIG
jgi:AraC-like DNA-binding protein